MWLDKKDPYTRGYPDKYAKNIQAWANLNPDATVILWNYKDIEREFPESIDYIRKIPVWISKCDLSRFLVLQKYGGFYFDMDFIPLRQLDSTVYDRDILLIQEPEEHIGDTENGKLFNGAIGAIPNHPLISGWISQMIESVEKVSAYNWDVMKVTGPVGFYDYYINNWESDIKIDHENTCLFLPVIRPVKNNPMKDSYVKSDCATVEPFCYTTWNDGSGWGADALVTRYRNVFIFAIFIVLCGGIYWMIRKPKRR